MFCSQVGIVCEQYCLFRKSKFEQEEWNAYETYRMFKHRNVEIFVCMICRFSTADQVYINNHSLMHKISEDVNFNGKCPCCNFRATRKLCLIRHMVSSHQCFLENRKRKKGSVPQTIGDKSSFCTCTTCTYEMKMNSHGLFHDKNTEKILSYKCFQCPYQTKWSYFLARHMKSHKNECPECDYKSKLKADLKKHILMHKTRHYPSLSVKIRAECPPKRQRITLHEGTVVKMYSCSKCDFQTIVKPTLKRHMMTHKKSRYP